MSKRAKLVKYTAPFFAVLLLLGLLIAVVDFCCFDRAFYKREYEKLSTAESIGMSTQDLDTATEVLLSYIKGNRADMDVQAEINGRVRAVFNEREISHMVDVKNLYQGAKIVGYTSLAIGALFFIVTLIIKNIRREALKGFRRGMYIYLAILGAIALFAVIDFNQFWTIFHHTFFTNNLWILDPRTDILIQMVPEQFFFDLVTRIILYVVMLYIFCFVGASLWQKRIVKKERENEQKNTDEKQYAHIGD